MFCAEFPVDSFAWVLRGIEAKQHMQIFRHFDNMTVAKLLKRVV